MSARDITAAVQTQMASSVVRPIIICELTFGSGTVRLWSGFGDLSWDSKTWTGSGDLGKISVVSETNSMEAQGITLQLDGIPTATIALVFGEDYQGRPAKLWLGFLDAAGAVVADPIGPYTYLMDVMSIQEGADTSTVIVKAENRLRILDRASNRRITDEDQRIDYPGDRAYEYVNGLQDKEIRFFG